jgi:sec-independent protein translocase protein TatA
VGSVSRWQGLETTAMLGGMPNIGATEIVLLLLLALLLFGARRLPDIGRSLGRGMREFKDAVTGKDGEEPERELPPASPEREPTAAPPREHDSVR